jgi:hypothetical protein
MRHKWSHGTCTACGLMRGGRRVAGHLTYHKVGQVLLKAGQCVANGHCNSIPQCCGLQSCLYICGLCRSTKDIKFRRQLSELL